MQVLVVSPPLIAAASLSKPLNSLSKAALSFSRAKPICPFPQTSRRPISVYKSPMNNLFNRLGFGSRPQAQADPSSAAIAQGPDDDVPSSGQQFAQFGAGCFWGVELAYQRVPGVTKTEVGYSHGIVHNPSYEDVCTGTTGHNEVVRVQYDPKECSFESLLDVFWNRHDPTTLNRQNQVSDHRTQKAGVSIGTSIFIARYKNSEGHILDVCT